MSFRNLYPNIATKYASHKIYYYPAAFIPQVVRFVLERYTKPKDLVLDMFAGGGTVGVESFITGRKSILIDINPLLDELIQIKTFTENIDKNKLYKDFEKVIENNRYEFEPQWGNITHWYDNFILDILKIFWGNFYNKEISYPLVIKFALLYISRKFSYSDDNIPKLYKSKKKVKKINEILKHSDIRKEIEKSFLNRLEFIYKAINEFKHFVNNDMNLYNPQVIIKDSYYVSKNFKDIITEELDCIITSPPYLQAQEYVRSIKLDLYWSNYNDGFIRDLSKLEIPYRKLPQKYKLDVDLLDELKKEMKFDSFSTKDKSIFDSYFFYIIETIFNYSQFLKRGGILGIFVGSPYFKGFKVNIWEILLDFFLKKNFVLENVFADPIVSRKLANRRNNNNPNGMDYEYLLIFKKM